MGIVRIVDNLILQPFLDVSSLNLELGNAIDDVADPYQCSQTTDDVSLYRRPLPAANLRFLRAAGGVFDSAEEVVEPVFHLKFLRNKWLRHDAEHGSEKDIKKSWSDLGQTVRALGLAGIPRTPDQFLALYLELLSRIRSFLIELLSRLQQ